MYTYNRSCTQMPFADCSAITDPKVPGAHEPIPKAGHDRL